MQSYIFCTVACDSPVTAFKFHPVKGIFCPRAVTLNDSYNGTLIRYLYNATDVIAFNFIYTIYVWTFATLICTYDIANILHHYS